MDILSEPPQKKRRVAIYIRVSTAEQRLDGYSLPAQKKKLMEYVNNNTALNLETKETWIYEDTHTGSDLNRDDLIKLLEDVRARKYDAVLVWKIDRLSRSLKHLLHVFELFQKNKVSFISVQENVDFKGPIGALIFQVFGAIAQFERELIKGRTSMGRIASAEAGNYTGTTVPYGYAPLIEKGKKGKRLKVVPAEKKWVVDIYDWYILEELGDGQIAKRLNELKVPRSRWQKKKEEEGGGWVCIASDGLWTDKMVTTILTNPLYRGLFVANDKDEEGNELPEEKKTIVTIPWCVRELTFIQAEHARRSRTGGAKHTDYLLTGKLKDMTLDKPLSFVGAPRYKGGYSYRRKQIKNKEKGIDIPVFEIPAPPIEEFVWSKIVDAMKNPEVFIKHYLSLQYADPTKVQKLEDNLNELRERRVKKDFELGKIENAYDQGAYSYEKMVAKAGRCNAEIAEMENLMQKIEDDLALLSTANVEVQKLKDASEQVKYKIDNLSRKEKKIFCNLFVESVAMHRQAIGKTKKGRNKWKVWATVQFRFNPDKFNELADGFAPAKQSSKPNKGALESENTNLGRDERT